LIRKIKPQVNIKFLTKLKKTAPETSNLLHELYRENPLSRAHVFEWHKSFSEERKSVEDDKQCGCLVMTKTDENVEEIRTPVRTENCLGIRMTMQSYMDKETIRQIPATNMNMRKLCAKIVPKNLPVFNQKTNTNAQTCSIFTRSCPM
jgi:hypothetical protein